MIKYKYLGCKRTHRNLPLTAVLAAHGISAGEATGVF